MGHHRHNQLNVLFGADYRQVEDRCTGAAPKNACLQLCPAERGEASAAEAAGLQVDLVLDGHQLEGGARAVVAELHLRGEVACSGGDVR
jgi:hypothetical protein